MSLSAQSALPIRVYWEDTDAGGIVYHASYLRFMERGRTELLRERGLDQHSLLAGQRLAFTVRRMAIEFRRPARLDDLLTVVTRAVTLGGASITLEQAVPRGAEVLAEARVTVACLIDGRAARLPPFLRARLLPQDTPA